MYDLYPNLDEILDRIVSEITEGNMEDTVHQRCVLGFLAPKEITYQRKFRLTWSLNVTRAQYVRIGVSLNGAWNDSNAIQLGEMVRSTTSLGTWNGTLTKDIPVGTKVTKVRLTNTFSNAYNLDATTDQSDQIFTGRVNPNSYQEVYLKTPVEFPDGMSKTFTMSLNGEISIILGQ